MIKLLIADDHKVYRKAIMQQLSMMPDLHFLGEAENGEQLIALIPEFTPHAILLDIQMPVMDGMTALKHIHQHHPEIKVIMLSLHNDPDVVHNLLEAGAHAFLTKNAEIDQMHAVISEAVGRNIYSR